VNPAGISGMKKEGNLKNRMSELATNSKNKNIRGQYRGGIHEFKKGHQPRSKNGGLLADSHNILNRWKNYFSQLLNAHRVSDVPPHWRYSPNLGLGLPP
jgi:hypothetical protein